MSLSTKKLTSIKKIGGIHKGGGTFKKKTAGGAINLSKSGKIVGQIVAQKLASSKIIGAVQAGFEIEEMENLRSILGVPIEGLASKLGISKATLHRRKA